MQFHPEIYMLMQCCNIYTDGSAGNYVCWIANFLYYFVLTMFDFFIFYYLFIVLWCSPRSKLHDPALHRMLHKIMQKVFALLIAEFQKLGATIVFANFSKIILDTGKSDLYAAQAYCDSLLKTIQTRLVLLNFSNITIIQSVNSVYVIFIFYLFLSFWFLCFLVC
jgi:hypothetical protein